MKNQLEGYGMRKRVDSIADEMEALKRLNEARSKAATPPISDWSIPAAEYERRTIDLAVVYDGKVDADRAYGDERVLHIAHACLIGQDELVATKESIEMVHRVAEHKSGRVVALAGLAWYELDDELPVEAFGICVCKRRHRDEGRWEVVLDIMREHGIADELEAHPVTQVRFSASALPGQEIGFVHSGEAEDIMGSFDAFSHRQFECTTVSHLKKPTRETLLSFVTGVLPGRILRGGSPTFSRDGVLVGLIADTERYASDAGRRAVVRGLAGHPRFKATA